MNRRAKVAAPRLTAVRSLIAELSLAGSISLVSVARHLEISPRTLQRRLSGASLDFRTLVEQSRFDMARLLLRETDLKVQAVAARLGYRTPGAFSRAFARWAGCTPRAYRNACAGQFQRKQDWREMGRRDARTCVAFTENQDFLREK
ncbi:hypothetical protein DCO57_04865 [Labrenzia sp. 011]|nr:hypothetical protein DCO57_04865 [Labrenzia sp. 011]